MAAWALAAPTIARAQPEEHVDLRYEVDPAVEGCLSEPEFRTVVTRRLGYDPHRPGATPSVEVRVRDTDAGLEGTIEWLSLGERRIGERHFSSPGRDCRDMTVTMAFVVAVQTQLMATEPIAEEPTEPTEAVPEPSSPADAGEGRQEPREVAQPTVPAEAPRQPPPTDGRERAEWFGTVGIGPAVGLGLAEHAVGLGRLFVSGHRDWLAVELGAEAALPSTMHVDGGAGFRQQLTLGTLATCGSTASFAACGVGKLGSLRVTGTGVDNSASPRGLVGQVGLRLAYSLRLDNHLHLQGHLDGLYLLTPWTVDLNQVEVWTMPQFSAIAGIAVASRFP